MVGVGGGEHVPQFAGHTERANAAFGLPSTQSLGKLTRPSVHSAGSATPLQRGGGVGDSVDGGSVSDGATVGASVGAAVGVADGSWVGRSVGALVGERVVGVSVVGTPVGGIVGDAVG